MSSTVFTTVACPQTWVTLRPRELTSYLQRGLFWGLQLCSRWELCPWVDLNRVFLTSFPWPGSVSGIDLNMSWLVFPEFRYLTGRLSQFNNLALVTQEKQKNIRLVCACPERGPWSSAQLVGAGERVWNFQRLYKHKIPHGWLILLCNIMGVGTQWGRKSYSK